jgi:hypothetical protein
MKRIRPLFNRRAFLATTLFSVGIFLAIFSVAANPPGEWTIVSSPNNGTFTGVTCASASDCWAVGYRRDPNAPNTIYYTLVERWNGISWSIVASPNASATPYNFLFGITCVSASDCWAVGNYYYNGSVDQTLIEHWDGISWAIVASPNTGAAEDNLLKNVTCASASDCWAVGYRRDPAAPNPIYTLVERWNGISWSIVASPNASTTRDNFLFGITCVSPSDCWAVGYYITNTTNYIGKTLIEHWDGTSWAIVTSPNTNINPADSYLYDVTCPSASDCWAVGYVRTGSANGQTLIERWEGSSWAIVTSPSGGTGENFLHDVTCVSGSDCWAVGHSMVGSSSYYQTLIERWDGTSWSITSSPNTSATENNYLRGVTCVSASDCWAVGSHAEHYAVAPTLTSAVSRKTHGTAGTFDVDLPFSFNLPVPAPGIECRAGGSTGGDHTLVFTFNNIPVSGSATVVSGTGSVVGSPTFSGHEMWVNLTGVTNAQQTGVILNVTDSSGQSFSNPEGIPVSMAVLLGDVNANGTVSNADVASIQAKVGATVTQSNFRNDVNANGTLSNGDLAKSQAQVGTQLSP